MHQRIVKIGNATLILARAEEVVCGLGPVDVLCIDPPYEFETSGGGKMRKERKVLEQIIEEDLDKGFDFQLINGLVYRSAVVFCHNDQLHKLLPHIAGNFRRHAVLFWEKSNPMPVANKHYMPDLEPYIHAWNEGGHPLGELVDKRRVFRSTNGKSEFAHPTVKPLDLMEKIMRNINGETVLDCFMGTGTTGVAAIKYGKKFIGIEKREKYFDIAVERIKKAVDERKAMPMMDDALNQPSTL